MPRVAVPPVLAPYVASLVPYDVETGVPGVHQGLPSTTLTFVLPVGEPLDVGWADRPATRARRWSTVSGLHTGPARIHHDGTQRGVQLGLTLAGARALLGVPAAALAGEIVELAQLDGPGDPALRHLPEQLADRTPEQAGRLVVRALVTALARHGAAGPRAEVGRALARLTAGVPVQRVAAEVGYSRRHLGTLVRAESGLSPKEWQRVARLERSRALLGRRPLREVAASCGYADQAHLTRDWRDLAGLTPGRWVREELPFVQDLREADPAG